MSKRNVTPARAARATAAGGDELDALAFHLSEALRITRDHPALPSCLYNGIAEAVCDFENDMPSLARASETREHIALQLREFMRQTAERKGGRR